MQLKHIILESQSKQTKHLTVRKSEALQSQIPLLNLFVVKELLHKPERQNSQNQKALLPKAS